MNPSEQASCRRCGQCCEKGGPALHLTDLDMVRSGVLDLDRLVTLRAGEPVRDQPRGRLDRLDRELVKIRGRDAGWACVFLAYDGQGLACCAIHENRPTECRALCCTDTGPLAAMYRQDRARRRDILPPGHALLELLEAHEAHCPVGKAVDLALDLDRAGQEERRERLNALAPLLAYDRQARASLAQRTPDLAPALDFLLGRPLATVLAPLGLELDPESGRARPRAGRD